MEVLVETRPEVRGPNLFEGRTEEIRGEDDDIDANRDPNPVTGATEADEIADRKSEEQGAERLLAHQVIIEAPKQAKISDAKERHGRLPSKERPEGAQGPHHESRNAS